MKKKEKKTRNFVCSDDGFLALDVLRSTGDQRLGWMAMYVTFVISLPPSLFDAFFLLL
jgi:hypothetical protein